jgi:hypothetical protein
MRQKPLETYFYITGKRLNKRQWDDLVKRYGPLVGDKLIEGRTTVAYRKVREQTEAERVASEGRA